MGQEWKIVQEGVDEGCFHCDDVPGTTLAIISMCVDIARWFDPAGSRRPQDLSATLGSIALCIVSADLTRTTKATGEGCAS